jgi:hypothetical protein
MQRFCGKTLLFTALFASCSVLQSFASPDQRLLLLIPPSAHVVAGINAPSSPNRPGSVVLTTNFNIADLQDFFALSGVDSSRSIHEVIFVSIDSDGTGNLREHSLLASGTFDQPRIYKAAQENGLALTSYRGIRLLVVQPFARERRDFNDVRWFVILDSNVLLFGTIASVQQELDRHLARSAPNPLLIGTLARIRHDDDTWCVVSGAAKNLEIRNAFIALDPRLAELANADAFQFGIRYRRQIELEYEVTTASASQNISDPPIQSVARYGKKESLLSSVGNTAYGVIKVSQAQYSAWLTQVSAHHYIKKE